MKIYEEEYVLMWVLGGAAPTKLPLPPTPQTNFYPTIPPLSVTI